jgi:hypothetical protein
MIFLPMLIICWKIKIPIYGFPRITGCLKSIEIFCFVMESPEGPVPYYRYTKAHGFLNNEFNGSANPCAHELEDGQLVFPSMEGFVFFTPQQVKTHYPAAKDMYLERAKVKGQMIQVKDKLF